MLNNIQMLILLMPVLSAVLFILKKIRKAQLKRQSEEQNLIIDIKSKTVTDLNQINPKQKGFAY